MAFTFTIDAIGAVSIGNMKQLSGSFTNATQADVGGVITHGLSFISNFDVEYSGNVDIPQPKAVHTATSGTTAGFTTITTQAAVSGRWRALGR